MKASGARPDLPVEVNGEKCFLRLRISLSMIYPGRNAAMAVPYPHCPATKRAERCAALVLLEKISPACRLVLSLGDTPADEGKYHYLLS